MSPSFSRLLGLLPLALSVLLFSSPLLAESLTLAVANSTCTVMKQVGEAYRRSHPVELKFICKSSGRLAKGLRGGAISADIYLSANQRWMDFMVVSGLVSAERVVSPWGNTLVVAAPKASPLSLDDWQGLASERVSMLMIGDPGTAPFGRYAKQALESTGLWDRVRGKVETRKHITLLANSLAAADDATVGFLFKTNLTDELRVVRTVDPAWHSPVRYYLAPLGEAAADPRVGELLAFIQGPEARELFRAALFDVSLPAVAE